MNTDIYTHNIVILKSQGDAKLYNKPATSSEKLQSI